jgi:hypothetical protein
MDNWTMKTFITVLVVLMGGVLNGGSVDYGSNRALILSCTNLTYGSNIFS